MSSQEIILRALLMILITAIYAGLGWLKDNFLAKKLSGFTNRFVDYTLIYVAALCYCYVLQ